MLFRSQGSLDEAATLDLEMSDQLDDEMKEIEERRAMEESGELPQPPSPRPMTPIPAKTKGRLRSTYPNDLLITGIT